MAPGVGASLPPAAQGCCGVAGFDVRRGLRKSVCAPSRRSLASLARPRPRASGRVGRFGALARAAASSRRSFMRLGVHLRGLLPLLPGLGAGAPVAEGPLPPAAFWGRGRPCLASRSQARASQCFGLPLSSSAASPPSGLFPPLLPPGGGLAARSQARAPPEAPRPPRALSSVAGEPRCQRAGAPSRLHFVASRP